MIAANNDIVEFDSVTVCHGPVKALEGVSFALQKGRIFGFLGPNGAGKTTTSYTMLGLLRPSEGRCHVATKRIGFVLDKPGLLDDLTLSENLQFFSRLRGIRNGGQERKRMEEVIGSVGLAGYEKKVVKTFSTGMKKRGELARALLADPDLLILDEPTSGLDPVGQVEFRKLMKALAVDKHCTTFIASHNLSEIESVCDEFAVINAGRIEIHDSIESLHNSGRTLEQVYLEAVKS